VTGQGALVVSLAGGQGQQQPRQVMATIDQADIRGSKPHNHDPSGAIPKMPYSRIVSNSVDREVIE
jgi:hypothetical protein